MRLSLSEKISIAASHQLACNALFVTMALRPSSIASSPTQGFNKCGPNFTNLIAYGGKIISSPWNGLRTWWCIYKWPSSKRLEKYYCKSLLCIVPKGVIAIKWCLITCLVICKKIVNMFCRFARDMENLIKTPNQLPPPPINEGETEWLPLSQGWIKINVNATCPTNQEVIVLVALTHDHLGVQKGLVSLLDDGKPVLEAELSAIWWGLRLAKELDSKMLIVEPDSLSMINIVNEEREMWPQSVRSFVAECKSMMSKFQDCNWSILDTLPTV